MAEVICGGINYGCEQAQNIALQMNKRFYSIDIVLVDSLYSDHLGWGDKLFCLQCRPGILATAVDVAQT